jgi:hypothetical protein
MVYVDKLGEFLVPILRGGGPNDRLTILQDGAPPHFQTTGSAGPLKSKVPTEMDWQGRGGPITLQPCSPDPTPLCLPVVGYRILCTFDHCPLF